MRAFVLLLSACFAAQLSAARPNILHIHADDHRADGLGALGAPGLITPHLDTLVARGMTFTRAYTQGSMIGAVCTPSRTMMLTGRSWQRIPGAKAARPEADNPATFLPSVLAAAGYRTWHMGKGGNAFTEGLRAFQTSILDDGKKEGDPATVGHEDAVERMLEDFLEVPARFAQLLQFEFGRRVHACLLKFRHSIAAEPKLTQAARSDDASREKRYSTKGLASLSHLWFVEPSVNQRGVKAVRYASPTRQVFSWKARYSGELKVMAKSYLRWGIYR